MHLWVLYFEFKTLSLYSINLNWIEITIGREEIKNIRRVFLTHREDSTEIGSQNEQGGSLQHVPEQGPVDRPVGVHDVHRRNPVDRDKTLLEVWSEKFAQNHGLLREFESPAYFSAKNGKVNREQRSLCFSVSKEIWKAIGCGTPKARRLCWVSMSHLMRLLCWSLLSLNRWEDENQECIAAGGGWCYSTNSSS